MFGQDDLVPPTPPPISSPRIAAISMTRPHWGLKGHVPPTPHVATLLTPAHHSAPAHSIFGPLRSCSAHVLCCGGYVLHNL